MEKKQQVFVYVEDEGWMHCGDRDGMQPVLDTIQQAIFDHIDAGDDEFEIRVRVKEMTAEEVEAIPEV